MTDEIKDEIKDVVSEFKARLHSPLFGSFIIAWLCINWYIPTVIIFYSQNDVKLDGYRSIADAVVSHFSWWYNALLPMLIASCYTFGYPYLRALIIEHQTQITTDSENRLVKITEDLNSHKKIVEQLNQKYSLLEELRANDVKELEKTNTSLSIEKSNFANCNNKYVEVERELSYQIEARKKNNDVNSPSFFTGIWELEFDNLNIEPRKQRWNISLDKIYLVGNAPVETIGTVHDIVYYDKKLAFTYQAFNTNIYSTFTFVTNEAVDVLVGTDNRGQKLSMRKIEQ